MKILHLLGCREEVGGIVTLINALHEETACLGVHHVLWVHNDFEPITTRHLDFRKSPYIWDEPYRGRARFAAHLPVAYAQLLGVLKRESFDILHGHNKLGHLLNYTLARMKHMRVLNTYHMYARLKGVYRSVSRHPLVHTVYLTPNMAAYYNMSDTPGKTMCISEACPNKYFEESLSPTTAPGETIRMVGAGSIDRRKNWMLLLSALAKSPERVRRRFSVRIYGKPKSLAADDRVYEKELHAFVRQHNLSEQVSFMGHATDMLSAYKQADWSVLLTTNEPCSLAVIEAQALGKPALVSKSGGSSDIVLHERTGLCFSPDDPDDLVRQLARIADGPPSLYSPERIRQEVVHRSAPHVAKQYMDLYASLV